MISCLSLIKKDIDRLSSHLLYLLYKFLTIIILAFQFLEIHIPREANYSVINFEGKGILPLSRNLLRCRQHFFEDEPLKIEKSISLLFYS